jgi:hypothetical protein
LLQQQGDYDLLIAALLPVAAGGAGVLLPFLPSSPAQPQQQQQQGDIFGAATGGVAWGGGVPSSSSFHQFQQQQVQGDIFGAPEVVGLDFLSASAQLLSPRPPPVLATVAAAEEEEEEEEEEVAFSAFHQNNVEKTPLPLRLQSRGGPGVSSIKTAEALGSLQNILSILSVPSSSSPEDRLASLSSHSSGLGIGIGILKQFQTNLHPDPVKEEPAVLFAKGQRLSERTNEQCLVSMGGLSTIHYPQFHP